MSPQRGEESALNSIVRRKDGIQGKASYERREDLLAICHLTVVLPLRRGKRWAGLEMSRLQHNALWGGWEQGE